MGGMGSGIETGLKGARAFRCGMNSPRITPHGVTTNGGLGRRHAAWERGSVGERGRLRPLLSERIYACTLQRFYPSRDRDTRGLRTHPTGGLARGKSVFFELFFGAALTPCPAWTCGGWKFQLFLENCFCIVYNTPNSYGFRDGLCGIEICDGTAGPIGRWPESDTSSTGNHVVASHKPRVTGHGSRRQSWKSDAVGTVCMGRGLRIGGCGSRWPSGRGW
mgnify:CR=1 FL=1